MKCVVGGDSNPFRHLSREGDALGVVKRTVGGVCAVGLRVLTDHLQPGTSRRVPLGLRLPWFRGKAAHAL